MCNEIKNTPKSFSPVSSFVSILLLWVGVAFLSSLEGVRCASLLDCTTDRPGSESYRTLYVPGKMVEKINNLKNADKKAHITALCCVYTHVEKIATSQAPYMILYDGSRRSYNNVAIDDFVTLAKTVMDDICAMPMGRVDCDNQMTCTTDAFYYDDWTFTYKNKKRKCKKLSRKNKSVICKRCRWVTDIRTACKGTCKNFEVTCHQVCSQAEIYKPSDATIRQKIIEYVSNPSQHKPIKCWDLSEITHLGSVFRDLGSFNEDISSWNTKGVTDMSGMFHGASSFNGDLSSWDISKVTSMKYMFYGARSFNGDLSSWDTSNFVSMEGMFHDASSFNGDLSSWDISKVTSMWRMFTDASSFNGDLSSWNTSKVKDMEGMFWDASSFNGDLSSWDTTKVTRMWRMFYGARSFIGDLSSWDTSNVDNMFEMFYGARSFNGDLSSWGTSNVDNMIQMFNGASSFNQNLCSWLFPAFSFAMFESTSCPYPSDDPPAYACHDCGV